MGKISYIHLNSTFHECVNNNKPAHNSQETLGKMNIRKTSYAIFYA